MNTPISDSIPDTGFSLSRKAKEAIKVGIAFAAVYGIALASGWLNPYWAGFAVAMVSLAPSGLSLKKGALRAAGTLPGCIAAVTIIALAPQERWLFLGLCCIFVSFTTYMMIIDEEKPYFWNVMGFTCLVIVVTAANSNIDDFFQHAIMRAIETVMGVIVYSLVSIFIWPQNNSGMIRKAYNELNQNQKKLLQNYQDIMLGKIQDQPLTNLSKQQVALLAKFSHSIQAESSENIRLFNNRKLLKGLQAVASEQMDCIEKWQLNLTSLRHINFNLVCPNLNEYFTQQMSVCDEIQAVSDGKKECIKIDLKPLIPDTGVLKTLSHFDRAAISLTIKELNEIDKNLILMLNYVQTLTGIQNPKQVNFPTTRSLWQKILTPTKSTLRGAAFPPLVMSIGFVIWIYINPPGHAGIFQMPGILAMTIASMPQFKIKVLLKPFIIIITLALLVNVFILPKLSLYAELAIVLFLCAFTVSYFLNDLAKLVGMLSVINIISIENQQSYNFAATLNTSLFILMAVALAYIVSYVLHSARPEKTIQSQVQYFFKKTAWLSTKSLRVSEKNGSWLLKCKLALNINEVKTLPKHIETWSHCIDYNAFDNTSKKQAQNLVLALQSLSFRIQQLYECAEFKTQNKELKAHLVKLKKFVEKPLQIWSHKPNAGNEQIMAKQQQDMEQLTTEMMTRINNTISEDEAESLLLVIASYRGVSEASLNYMHAAQAIDWTQWKKERFS